jgi:hypothetical protein
VSWSRPASVRAVRAVGQDGLAIRTGQLRSTRPRLTRSRCRFRIDRVTPVTALRGPAPHGASRDGPPSPRRLEQPSPCTSPISDAPRRRRGHRLPVPMDRREAGSTRTSRCAPCVDPRDLDRHRAAPCGTTRATIGTPSVVSRPAGLPRPSRLRAPSGLNTLRNLAHRSHPGAAASCISTLCGVPLGQRRAADLPCGSSCVTTRDASDRLLPSHVFVRAPAPRRFPMRPALSRLRDRGDRLPHVSAIRFGGPHVLRGFIAAGLLFPS